MLSSLLAALLAVAVPGFLLGPALSLVLPAITGLIASNVYQWVKRATAWEQAHPAYHSIIMGAFSIVTPILATIIPGYNAQSFGDLDPTTVQQVVLWASTQLTHALIKGPAKK